MVSCYVTLPILAKNTCGHWVVDPISDLLTWRVLISQTFNVSSPKLLYGIFKKKQKFWCHVTRMINGCEICFN